VRFGNASLQSCPRLYPRLVNQESGDDFLLEKMALAKWDWPNPAFPASVRFRSEARGLAESTALGQHMLDIFKMDKFSDKVHRFKQSRLNRMQLDTNEH
jgi:hypothetical protein